MCVMRLEAPISHPKTSLWPSFTIRNMAVAHGRACMHAELFSLRNHEPHTTSNRLVGHDSGAPGGRPGLDGMQTVLVQMEENRVDGASSSVFGGSVACRLSGRWSSSSR